MAGACVRTSSNVMADPHPSAPSSRIYVALSPPCVDRDGLLVVAAHDPPIPVRFAAHHYHMDVLATEHRDQLLRRCLELRGPRLLPERRPRVDIVLDELVVPVLAGWHACVVIEPLDELLLGREPATIDELPRCDRIEQ